MSPFRQYGSWLLSALFYSGLMVSEAQAAETTTPKKPLNVVVIFIDDLGYADIEPFGSTINSTPHLNRMAEEGSALYTHFSYSR